MFKAGEFDVCTIIYARFKSAMSQIVTAQQLIPFVPVAGEEAEEAEAVGMGGAVYEYEPDESEILASLAAAESGNPDLQGACWRTRPVSTARA